MFTFLKKMMKSRKLPAPQVSTPSCAAQEGFLFAGWVVSDLGRLRGNNEDNFLLGPHYNTDSRDRISASHKAPGCQWVIAGVFDGMGGGEAGELASRSAAEACRNHFSALPRNADTGTVEQALRQAYLEANNYIQSLHGQYRIFGTTGTVLCSDGQQFKLFHLGDSRAYLLREGKLFRLTKDQTLAQMKMEMGMYDEGSPQAEEEKHKLTEYIGRDWTRENLRPTESQWCAICPKDLVLLCSDGLYDMCSDQEILRILTAPGSLEEKARNLVSLANSAGGHDNITCLLAMFTQPGRR